MLFVREEVRSFRMGHAVKLQTAFNVFVRDDMKLIVTDESTGTPITDLIPEEGAIICGKKMARVDAILYIESRLPEKDFTIYSGLHRSYAWLTSSATGSLVDYFKVVSPSEAKECEIRDNMAHELALKMIMLEKRKNALRLYREGSYRKESELMERHGYLKGQAMNSHNTALLICDYGCMEDEILAITAQKELSALAKIAKNDGKKAVHDYLANREVEVKVKPIAYKEIGRVLTFAEEGIVKSVLEAIMNDKLFELEELAKSGM